MEMRKAKEKEKNNNRLPAWMFQAPPTGDAHKTKTWKDYAWHWCGKSTGGKC